METSASHILLHIKITFMILDVLVVIGYLAYYFGKWSEKRGRGKKLSMK